MQIIIIFIIIFSDLRPLLEEVRKSFPDLVVDCTSDGNTVTIHRPHLSTVGPSKLPMFNPRLCLQATLETLTYSFEGSLQIVATGSLASPHDFDAIKAFLKTMKPDSGFVICPGLPSREYPPPAKRLKVSSEPLEYRRHENCLIWHVPKNRKLRPSNAEYNMCTPCKRLFQYLIKQPHLKGEESWTDPSSTYPESYLTSHQRSIRYRKQTLKVKALEMQVKKLEKKISETSNQTNGKGGASEIDRDSDDSVIVD